MKAIYIGQAAKIWDCDKRTVDKYIKAGTLKVVGRDPLGHRLLNEDQVVKLKPQLPKRRVRGKAFLPKGRGRG